MYWYRIYYANVALRRRHGRPGGCHPSGAPALPLPPFPGVHAEAMGGHPASGRGQACDRRLLALRSPARRQPAVRWLPSRARSRSFPVLPRGSRPGGSAVAVRPQHARGRPARPVVDVVALRRDATHEMEGEMVPPRPRLPASDAGLSGRAGWPHERRAAAASSTSSARRSTSASGSNGLSSLGRSRMSIGK